jgi:Spy/CpxP family protein refolding chaperone
MIRNIKNFLAIACVTVAVGAAMIPSIVLAQNNNQNTTETRKPRQGEGWKKLNLTEAQKTQMKAIHQGSKTRRDAVFTPEQRALMAKAREAGDRKGVGKQLALTDAQKQDLKAIREDTKTQMKGILTPEQQQQMEQMKQQRQQNRQQRQQNSGMTR